jgi:hypothetical protein
MILNMAQKFIVPALFFLCRDHVCASFLKFGLQIGIHCNVLNIFREAYLRYVKRKKYFFCLKKECRCLLQMKR